MSEADTMRGEEVAIGKQKFLMPKGAPVSDQEIIECEELIAKIDLAGAPFRQIADRAATAKKYLREEITASMRLRIEPEDKDQKRITDAPGVQLDGDRPASSMSGSQLRAIGEARRKNSRSRSAATVGEESGT